MEDCVGEGESRAITTKGTKVHRKAKTLTAEGAELHGANRWLVRRSSTPDPSPRWRERAVFGMTHS